MTPFGRYMRTLRLDQSRLLKDVADDLNVTSAYLSALEHGKKGQPSKQLLQRIIDTQKLTPTQAKELHQSVKNSETSFDIPSRSTPFAFETANAFARRLPVLTEDQLRKIKEVLSE